MADLLQQAQADVNRCRRLLAQSEITGIPEAIQEAQERLQRALQVYSALVQQRYCRVVPARFLPARQTQDDSASFMQM
jgi:hypothetical protein